MDEPLWARASRVYSLFASQWYVKLLNYEPFVMEISHLENGPLKQRTL